MIPALEVAIAGKPSSSKTRALGTSQAFGRMRSFLPRWSSRNSSAFRVWFFMTIDRRIGSRNDLQDQFAASVTQKTAFKRLAGPRERKHRVDDHANAAGVDESRDLNELGPVRLHQHGNTTNAVFRGDWFRNVAGDRDEDATRTQHGPGSIKGVASDGIDDRVDASDPILETSRGIVHYLVGTEFLQERDIPFGGGPDDVGSARVRELDSEGADPARGAVDEDAIARSHARVIEQRLPRREAGERHRGRVNVVEGAGLRGQVGGPNRDEFGRGTVTPEVQQAVDGFASLHIGYTGPHSLHGSGDLKARHDRSAVLAVRIGPRGVPGELGRSDGGRVNPDEGLPRRDPWLGTVFVDQRLGPSSRTTSNGFHESASLASREADYPRHHLHRIRV